MPSNDPDYWLQLSDLYIHATVKDNTPIAPDDLKKMNALFQKTVELAKDNPFVLAKVADFDVLTRQVEEAIPLYQKVLGLKGDSTDPVLLSVREKLAGSYIATRPEGQCHQGAAGPGAGQPAELQHLRIARQTLRGERGLRRRARQLPADACC